MAASCPFQPHWDLYPRVYVVPKISTPLLDQLDGDLTKEVWNKIPFSDVFDDIRGADDAPPDERPNHHCRTRFKAAWDETHLYIGAILESDFETQAHFTERNSPIFQKDSDFEVFVDPLGSCHNYKELEVNAINTIWNLMLDKPYDDGGVEHSGRIAEIGEKLYYEVWHQKTATQLLHGRLNDPNHPATWSIEVALSYKDLLAKINTEQQKFVPLPGSMLRINFSRVEKQGDINWTWQPQIVWDPVNRRYSGYVAMHLPDAWGYFVLGEEENEATNETDLPPRDPSWPGRLAAMNVYYAQKVYSKQQHEGDGDGTNGKKYASTIEDLQGLIDEAIVKPFHVEITLTADGYIAKILGNPDESIVTVTQDRLVEVSRNPNNTGIVTREE